MASKPGPKDISSLIGYQEGSVVSRELIHKAGGTVTLFAFDIGQGLSEHTAPFDALVLLLEGRAEITVSGAASMISEGQMLVLPAGKTHSVMATERFKMMLVMIRSAI